MPNIRKISFLVILFLLSFAFLMAENETGGSRGESRYSLSLNPVTGVLIGKTEEHLFKYDYNDQYVSQLIWNLKPLVYTGIEVFFGPGEPFIKSGFITAASLKFGLPLKTGIIEDRDWQDDNFDYLTNYSRHDSYAQNTILADVSAGYSWHIRDFLTIGAFAEFSYMYFSFMAENGYFQYAADNTPLDIYDSSYDEWDESIPKISASGAVIRYIQNWFILSPGLSLKGRLGKYFSLEGCIKYSPIIYCSDRDDHLWVDKYGFGKLFYGYYYFGHHINGTAGLGFSPKKNLELSLSLSYRHIMGMRNKSYYIKTGAGTGTITYSNYDGGVGYSAFDLKLGAKIRLYGR